MKDANAFIGQRFGRLVVLEEIRGVGHHTLWRCQCDCGSETQTRSTRVKTGVSRSCGCTEGRWRHGHSTATARTKEYRAWEGIVQRCTNPATTVYRHYGGRGIRLCNRWRHGDDSLTGYECFLRDIGTAPSSEHSVDRIDVNGDYEPGNVRWATRLEQARNFRKSKFIEWRGKRRLLLEVCEEAGVSIKTVRGRLARGWSLEDALSATLCMGPGSRRARALASSGRATE